MRIEHMAIWTQDLERLREFYSMYFNAQASGKYTNEKTRFESYFLSFEEGGRLELMQSPNVVGKMDPEGHFIGFAHLAISLGGKEDVIALTERLRWDGYTILSEPRTTGDGYFESVIYDPDGNRIEITV